MKKKNNKKQPLNEEEPKEVDVLSEKDGKLPDEVSLEDSDEEEEEVTKPHFSDEGEDLSSEYWDSDKDWGEDDDEDEAWGGNEEEEI
jgi:hypothetical protein